MKSVYSSGNGHNLSPNLHVPSDGDWQKVRDGVRSLKRDVATHVAKSIERAAADNDVRDREYFAKDAFSIGAFKFGKGADTIEGAMKRDIGVGSLRAGQVDSFDIRALRQLSGEGKIDLDPKVRQDINAKVAAYDQAIEDGVIQTGAYVDDAGVIHELTEGRIDVSYDAFLQTMPPENWSPNLPRYKGGEVAEVDRREHGDGSREVYQQERMSIDSVPNNLDMTKDSIVEVGPDRSRVSWHVFHSDPTARTLGQVSVQKDDGYLEFIRTDDDMVLARCHSAHKISTPSTKLARFFLGKSLTNEITGQTGLTGFFKDVVQNYRDIATGKVSAAVVDR